MGGNIIVRWFQLELTVEKAIVFSTIHGSRLYGFAHEGSDYDRFTVVEGKARARQHTNGDDDHVTMGLSTFLELANSGSHQSVEALFSKLKEWGPAGEMYAPMLSQMRVFGPAVNAKYSRTIKAFCFGDFKRRRHAVRLKLNQNELARTGQIQRVTLTPSRVKMANRLASTYEGEDLLSLLITSSSRDWI